MMNYDNVYRVVRLPVMNLVWHKIDRRFDHYAGMLCKEDVFHLLNCDYHDSNLEV